LEGVCVLDELCEGVLVLLAVFEGVCVLEGVLVLLAVFEGVCVLLAVLDDV
jgi:hypothetical protein